MIGTVICDAHAHMGSGAEVKERIRDQIPTLLCASTPAEAERLTEIIRRGKNSGLLIPTFGLHPWHAGEYSVEEMKKYLDSCSVIGEIGMDSVWCEVPLPVQQAVLEQQLLLAAEQKKPVILHTKGQEAQIAELIGRYPNTYLVHWYSSEQYVEEYLKLDCYFSIGPDVWWNRAVQRVARLVPENRILVETDGMSAVKWAYEEAEAEFSDESDGSGIRKRPVPGSVREALTRSLEETARIRSMETEKLKRVVRQNFEMFCGCH